MKMTALLHDPEQTELASRFTVSQYRMACSAADRDAIAEAIRRRFTERYINPATLGRPKHGFTIMAISCLMIEALESFMQGWRTSKGRSEAAFRYFFDRNDQFREFRGHATDFYKHVRSGILHQAETTGGWRILRVGKLLEPQLTINASLFMESLQTVLDQFCNSLKVKDWDSPEWRNVRRKVDAVCDNCTNPSAYGGK